MSNIIYVFMGGGFGAVLRYLAGGLVHQFVDKVFPWGTLAVNLSGSFAIGFLWMFCEALAVAPGARTFIFIGILGGYTTFSSFGLETFHLLRDSQWGLAAANVLVANIGGIAMVFGGFLTAKIILQTLR